jgi:glutathione synthase
LVSRDVPAIERFVAKHGRVVIKPLEGTRGQDVFVLEAAAASSNVRQIIDVVVRQGYAVVQEFVAGAERGDVRVTVVDGAILELDGQPAAVGRVPNQGDFRSNLHAGGSAAPASVTDDMRDAVVRIAPLLANEGLAHVGVDFVGNRILELNVFSPGGLHPCQRLYGKDFSDIVLESFEARARTS